MNSNHHHRVLVLDSDMVNALTIARSLAKRGCTVDLAGPVPKPLAGYSNKVERVITCPDPLVDEVPFLAWLSEHTQAIPYDLVIPVTERSLVPISAHRDRFTHVRVALPATDSLEKVLNKAHTMALAQQVGVPVPTGILISELEEISTLTDTIEYPVVIKPARSVGSNELGSSQLQVSYAFDDIQLQANCKHALSFGPVLLQQYFKGQGVGVELIARDGKICYAFQHLRLHEVPLTGGGSTLRKSVPIEDELLKAAERLIAALNWTGVAMVEFKWNPDTRDFCLMEINGRFWGSLPLAVAAGADFPAMLLELELYDEVGPSAPYVPGLVCRKLSSDLHWYEAIIRRGSLSPIVAKPGAWQVLKGLGLFLSLRHRFDVQSITDPLPGFIDIGRIISAYTRRASGMIGEKIFIRRQRRAWQNGSVAKTIAGANSILFLCFGNINRSALAQVMIQSSAENEGYSVRSAGFFPVEGRPADPVMVEVAKEHGFDLRPSRSTTITRELIDESDIIFVMEAEHLVKLREMDESVAEKTWLLGAQSSNSTYGAEIADPYGRSRAQYERCYQHIARSVEAIKCSLTP